MSEDRLTLVILLSNCATTCQLTVIRVVDCLLKAAVGKYGLEPPYLHSGLSLMALYQNPEFSEDWGNFFFAQKKKT